MENLEQDFIEKKDGCVYFFKHKKLKPIKIGYSTNESPLDRFDQFKTYAPFGAELIGYIRTKEPLKLEQKLHKKYETKRLNGEWFDISIEDVENDILINSTDEDNQERTQFYIKYINLIIPKENFTSVYFDENIVKFLNSCDLKSKMNRMELKKQFLSKFPNENYTSQQFNKDVKKYCSIREIPLKEAKFIGCVHFLFGNKL
jgi:mRNA-degrading endonuclease YafQ of YafQ-DinJ toxin-antitoxin module